MNTAMAGLTAQGRLDVLDRLRGIALLGILFFNIQTYALFAFLEPAQVFSLQLDQPNTYLPAQFLVQWLVKGEFYSIYSFLFGLGFYLLMQKCERDGQNAVVMMKRRLSWLLVLGLVHALLFWFGDVLHKYALLGFSLLYFYRKDNGTLLRWVLGLCSFVVLFQLLTVLLLQPAAKPQDPEMTKVIMHVVDSWQHGSFLTVLGLQKLGTLMLWLMSVQHGFAGLVHYEMMFLLGLYCGRIQLFRRLPEFAPVLRAKLLWLLPLALLLKLPASLEAVDFGLMQGNGGILLQSLSEFIATPLLAIAYLIAFSLYFSQSDNLVLHWIGQAGRIGLTNYLMQSLICMLLFYGYAGGLSGQLNLWQALVVALAIYLLQLLFSHYWLKRYQTGPFEALWRRFSTKG